MATNRRLALISGNNIAEIFTLHLRLHLNAPGILPEKFIGACGLLSKIFKISKTKICDFPYPIYDLIKDVILYLRYRGGHGFESR